MAVSVAQVQKVSEEVAAYRATVPAFLADQLAENLVQCRPMDAETAELAGAVSDAAPLIDARTMFRMLTTSRLHT